MNTHPVSNTDIRVLFRIACSVPAVIQWLRHCKAQLTNRLLGIGYTQEVVLMVRCAPHASVSPIADSCGGRGVGAWGSVNCSPQTEKSNDQAEHDGRAKWLPFDKKKLSFLDCGTTIIYTRPVRLGSPGIQCSMRGKHRAPPEWP